MLAVSRRSSWVGALNSESHTECVSGASVAGCGEAAAVAVGWTTRVGLTAGSSAAVGAGALVGCGAGAARVALGGAICSLAGGAAAGAHAASKSKIISK